MVQVNVVTAPTTVPAEAAGHAESPPVPLTFQVSLLAAALGAVAPAVPVTTAVKVMVEPKAPPPLSVRTTVGVTLAIVTLAGAEAPSAK